MRMTSRSRFSRFKGPLALMPGTVSTTPAPSTADHAAFLTCHRLADTTMIALPENNCFPARLTPAGRNGRVRLDPRYRSRVRTRLAFTMTDDLHLLKVAF